MARRKTIVPMENQTHKVCAIDKMVFLELFAHPIYSFTTDFLSLSRSLSYIRPSIRVVSIANQLCTHIQCLLCWVIHNSIICVCECRHSMLGLLKIVHKHQPFQTVNTFGFRFCPKWHLNAFCILLYTRLASRNFY